MALLFKLSVTFILMTYWVSVCSSEENRDLRLANPHFNKLCDSYKRNVYSRSQKIICIFCKGIDISCFETTTPVTSKTTTAKPVPSSSVKSTLPFSTPDSDETKPATAVTVPAEGDEPAGEA